MSIKIAGNVNIVSPNAKIGEKKNRNKKNRELKRISRLGAVNNLKITIIK